MSASSPAQEIHPLSNLCHVDANRTKRLSRGKLWLFRTLTTILVVGSIEVSSLAIWKFWPPKDLQQLASIRETVAALGTEKKNQLEVLHPYLGWIFSPDGTVHDEAPVNVNSLGFVDSAPTLRKRSPDRIIIGVCGGSVAQQMTFEGEQAFRNRLSASPSFKGRTIEIVRLAMAGYKQPQQLMALNYVLALGGEFDFVVNIDGFNETGLVVGENDTTGVFAAYPRNWQARLLDVVDPRNSAMSYRLLEIRASRQARAQWWMKSMLRHTWTGSLIWAAQDERLRNQQVNLGVELTRLNKIRGFGFARQGPRQLYTNENEMYSEIVKLWRNSSLQMHHLCVGRGIKYLHFLQPNQYHAGSKPLSPVEKEKYYSPSEDFAVGVKKGYPRLLTAGVSLRNDGVAFQDLTQLFSSETETVYSDYFCHYNKRGTDLLAEAVADIILDTLSNVE